MDILPHPIDATVAPTSYPIKLNQQRDCFTIITLDGFVVYQIEPLQIRFSRTFGKALLLVEILQKTNIVVIVYATDPTLLFFWDDRQGKIIKEFSFESAIINLKFHNNFLIIILMQAMIVYQYETFQLVARVSTSMNERGLGLLIDKGDSAFLTITPSGGHELGEVQIIDNTNQMLTFRAHQNKLVALAINSTETVIATASDRGTLIRTWSVDRGTMLAELRRGAEMTTIHDISFHYSSDLICVTSATDTAHFFSLEDPEILHQSRVSVKKKKSRSLFNKAWTHVTKDLPGYLTSHTSLLQVSVSPYSLPVFRDTEIIFLTPQGQLYKYVYQFDPPGSRQSAFHQLLNP